MMIKLLGQSGALWSRGRQGLGALSLALLQACAGGEVTHEPARHTYEQRYGDNGKLFGQDIVLVGGHSDDRGYEKTVVNPYMWRAAVEVLDTMGIEMASSKTGMIETAWHAPEGSHGEEFKVIATVFCGTTRSTGVKVVILSRKKDLKKDTWVSQGASPSVVNALEETILKRARILKSQVVVK